MKEVDCAERVCDSNSCTQTARWIPVTLVGGIELGLSNRGHWTRKISNELREFPPGSDLLWLMPVLDLKLPKVKDTLKSGLRDAGLDPCLLRRFPFRELVLKALNWPSDSWIWDGLSWARHYRQDPEVASVLLKISAISSGRPRRARVQARRLLCTQSE